MTRQSQKILEKALHAPETAGFLATARSLLNGDGGGGHSADGSLDLQSHSIGLELVEDRNRTDGFRGQRSRKGEDKGRRGGSQLASQCGH